MYVQVAVFLLSTAYGLPVLLLQYNRQVYCHAGVARWLRFSDAKICSRCFICLTLTTRPGQSRKG